ncbi:XdhC family protein [Pseudomaricurvus alkylphenolicus]|uniref:XdhC family protein n=1 Tax=Pseudomaricurvus alkylphenolicus TaxID=1306991 RepID=UPI001421D887|nr:XdhC family protein [Pseudomaricurvus alkylphenolicus]NIB41455.1 XdhC family protein [Pseudomaricurvus alkylphenolicus]
MQTTELEVLTAALAGVERGAQVTLVSVVQTWGTSPRPVGSLLVASSDGHFAGSVSGGCVEDDLLQQLFEKPPTKIQLVKYGETAEERNRFGLPCGGTLQLLLEPLTDATELRLIIEAIHQRQTLVRTVCLKSGRSAIQDQRASGTRNADTHKPSLIVDPDGKPHSWTTYLGPLWQLLIVGAGQTSKYLAQMAAGLGYRVLISDPRPEYRQDWDNEHGELLDGYPDDVVAALKPDPRTAIVTLTHDPKLDDLAIMEAVRTNAFYVGALGSVRTSQNRRQRLKQHFSYTDDELNRLHAPVGLTIGSKTPPEIALAVLVELTAIRNGVKKIAWEGPCYTLQ